jgi:carboxyl-terminal processing protease
MRGLADGLDPDSAYLLPSAVKALEGGETLPEGETGIDLTRQYYLRVISVADGSPAARAGLRGGDFIRAIDGKPTRDMSVYEGTRLLRGGPGTKVSLLVIRGNAADPHVVELTREKASPQAITGRIVNGSVGVVRVPAFDAKTSAALRRQIAALTQKGADRLIIDLRGSSLGEFEHGLAAASLFVKEGAPLAQKLSRSGQKVPIPAPAADGEPIAERTVLVVNGGTSGAAELFASALSGNGRAKLVGGTTNGRSGLQKLVKLPQGHGLWLTHTSYGTPKGDPIHEKGLTPDVEVEEPDIEFGTALDPAAKDPVLEKALELVTATQTAAD